VRPFWADRLVFCFLQKKSRKAFLYTFCFTVLVLETKTISFSPSIAYNNYILPYFLVLSTDFSNRAAVD
jgi:hypothetical protein